VKRPLQSWLLRIGLGVLLGIVLYVGYLAKALLG